MLLRALADPLRWRIVEALAAEELCVCHLAADLEVDQPSVSHHLRTLREAGLVESERYRYWTYYRLAPAQLVFLAGRLADLATGAPPPRTARRPCG
jgi:ArsR family transcriptional regulator